MAVTSDELNFLIYRYLMESGFTHSAFAFGYESFVHKSKIDSNDIPPGALISFIQKGLQYLEMEANLGAEEGSSGDIAADYAALTSRELLTKSLDDLKASLVKRRAEAAGDHTRVAPPAPRGRAAAAAARAAERHAATNAATAAAAAAAAAAQVLPVVQKRAAVPLPPLPEPPAAEEDHAQPMDVSAPEAAATDPTPAAPSATAALEAPKAPSAAAAAETARDITGSQVTILKGHSDEVFTCAWNPAFDQLASGAGDGTGRIWDMTQLLSRAGSLAASPSCQLMHSVGTTAANKDVTILDWTADGSRLATGSYDGIARIWTRDGKLANVLEGHKGPIFSLKWSRNGELLLSGSVDKSAIVWDGRSGALRQKFEFHAAPTMDVDWGIGTNFATCSSDKKVYVCRLGDTVPVRCLEGHTNEVNNVKWNPSGQLLATCSDDMTARVWTTEANAATLVMRGHTQELYTLRWSPTGPGSPNPELPSLIVTASFDTAIRIWDATSGACLHKFDEHTEPIYSVIFSPNGRYLASGAFDKNVDIWDVQAGSLVRSYASGGGVFEVSWDRTGRYVAACLSDKTIAVLDPRL